MKFLQYILVIIISTSVVIGYFVYNIAKPCDTPITYSIGTFDNEFGISKNNFLDDLDIAISLWDNAIGKKLFVNSVDGDLTINLKYDDRQKTTQENSVLKADVDKTNKLADSVKKQFLDLKATFSQKELDYKNSLSVYQQHQSNFNSEVSYWNKAGGAPKDQFNKLNQEKSELVAEYNLVESKRIQVNDLAGQINEFVNKYNLLVNNANSTIATINQSAGKEFSEGIYDPNTNEIDIYQFDGKQKLIRVLTHELGHALGLDHNDNPLSIMYELNEADNEVLSKEDVQALKAKCEIQ